MSKTHDYEVILAGLADWDEYLLSESGLPGPRGNLELADAFARVADEPLMMRYAAMGPDVAPTNSPQEFLAFCGVLGFGRLVAEGKTARLADLRRAASDPRWRLREACARGMQIAGDANLALVQRAAEEWCSGSRLEQRAALASLCEPRLLRNPEAAQVALRLLDHVTSSMRAAQDAPTAEFRVLRQGLGYCWSVAVVALPDEGKPAMEKWLAEADSHIRRVIRDNLGKARLERMDAAWVSRCRAAMPA